MQRLDVREEDLTEGKNKLGMSGPAKSKTFQVMEEAGEDTQTHTHKVKLKGYFFAGYGEKITVW